MERSLRNFASNQQGSNRPCQSLCIPALYNVFDKIRVFDFGWLVLAAQEELEALLWICFTLRWLFSIFEEKIFWSKKKFFLKKLFFFILGKSIFVSKFFSSKNRSIFFDENGFRDFFLQKSHCGKYELPLFNFWRKLEKFWPLSAQYKYGRELIQNVPYWADIVRALADLITF